MRSIPDFEPKRFFDDGSAGAARANLSPSFAEPLSTAELLAFEPDAAAQLTRLPLSYPGVHGGLELRAAIANRYRQLGPDDALSLLFMASVGAAKAAAPSGSVTGSIAPPPAAGARAGNAPA